MLSNSTATIGVAFVSSIIGRIGGGIMNLLLNRRWIGAETDKIIVEPNKIQTERQNLNETVIATTKEQLLFDGSAKITGFHVRGEGGHLYARSGANVHIVGARGEGELTILEEQILNVVHANADGRYEVLLQEYRYNGQTSSVIPKNDAIAGKRTLRISCEAKTSGGAHIVRFVIRNPETGQRLAQELKNINNNEWTPISAFLQADASQNAEMRIYHETGSVLPSRIQLRKLILAEQRE